MDVIYSRGKLTFNLSEMILLFGIWSIFPDSMRSCSSANVKMRDSGSSSRSEVEEGSSDTVTCFLTCSTVMWFPVTLRRNNENQIVGLEGNKHLLK